MHLFQDLTKSLIQVCIYHPEKTSVLIWHQKTHLSKIINLILTIIRRIQGGNTLVIFSIKVCCVHFNCWSQLTFHHKNYQIKSTANKGIAEKWVSIPICITILNTLILDLGHQREQYEAYDYLSNWLKFIEPYARSNLTLSS